MTAQAVVLRASPAHEAEQGSVYSAGISAETAGSTGLWLGMVSLPPGRRTSAHFHDGHETALYMVSGAEVELRTGPDLEHREILRPGDFIFIPPGLAHVAFNRSDVPAVYLGARTDPNGNESVVPLPELEARVAEMERTSTGA